MSDLARAYFAPSEDAFWRWPAQGEELSFVSGKLIAFRQQVVQILEHAAHSGLPQFPELAMLMVSFSKEWAHDEVEHGIFSPFLNAICTTYPEEWQDAKELVAETMDLLEAVNAQPFSQTSSGQATIAELALQHSIAIPEDQAPALIAALRDQTVNLTPLPPRTPEDGLAEMLQYIKSLHQGLSNVDFHVVAVRAATGVDEIPTAPEDLEIGRDFSYLIEQLKSDDEFRALANLATRLAPASQLPRVFHMPIDVTGDGYGDISNRGPLHRLLLTELAYDGLTMCARLANNEALYIRREPAQESLDRRRILLIDCGIRMWGTPRIMATAAALAFAAGAENGTVQIWRNEGQHIAPARLSTRTDLIEHLEVLDAEAHPGRALHLLTRLIPARDRELILITHERVIADPDFRRIVSQLDTLHLYAATVNSQGRFRVYTLTSTGNLRLREAEMDGSLLRDACAPTRAASSGERPLIYDLDDCPLRVPCELELAHVRANGPSQALALLKGGILLHFDDPARCPRLLSARLPPATPGVAFFDDGACLLLARAGESRARIAIHADLLGQVVSTPVQLRIHTGLPVRHEHHVAFYVAIPDLHVVDVDTGEVLSSVDCREHKLRHHDGRFCKSTDREDNGWYHFSWADRKLMFTRIGNGGEMVHPFDRFDHLGPWAVTGDGDIVDLSIGRSVLSIQDAQTPLQWAQNSPDGHILVVCDAASHLWRVDLADASAERLDLRPDQTEEWQDVLDENRSRATAVTRPPLDTPNGMMVQAGRLFLQFEQRGWTELAVDEGDLLLQDADPLVVNRVSFSAVPAARGFAIRQWRAELDAGNCVVDSLSLLHIRSEDTSQPEVSIVLTEGPLAAWSSNGLVVGPPELTNGSGTPATEFLSVLRDLLDACE